MAMPMRSLTDPPGLNASSFAKIEASGEEPAPRFAAAPHRRLPHQLRNVDRDFRHTATIETSRGHNRHMRRLVASTMALTGALAILLPAGVGGGRARWRRRTPTLATIEASFSPNPGRAHGADVRDAPQRRRRRRPGSRAQVHAPDPRRARGARASNGRPPRVLAGAAAAPGARGCPARSQIGSGSSVIAWREGGRTVTENARVWEFVGPTNGPYRAPDPRRRHQPDPQAGREHGRARRDSAAPTRPRSKRRSRRSPLGPARRTPRSSASRSRRGTRSQPRFSGRGVYGGMGLFVPSPCPLGGYPWSAEFSFAGGATQQATTAIACP